MILAWLWRGSKVQKGSKITRIRVSTALISKRWDILYAKQENKGATIQSGGRGEWSFCRGQIITENLKKFYMFI